MRAYCQVDGCGGLLESSGNPQEGDVAVCSVCEMKYQVHVDYTLEMLDEEEA